MMVSVLPEASGGELATIPGPDGIVWDDPPDPEIGHNRLREVAGKFDAPPIPKAVLRVHTAIFRGFGGSASTDFPANAPSSSTGLSGDSRSSPTEATPRGRPSSTTAVPVRPGPPASICTVKSTGSVSSQGSDACT